MAILRDVLEPRRWGYLLRGIARLGSSRSCPCCGESEASRVDRKWVYGFYVCHGCEILYRHPCEDASSMSEFYQGEYAEPGLTTELPSRAELDALMASNFAGASKDFSRVISCFEALGIAAGASVLDFGANWGYGTLQLRRAGYLTEAFELSRSRAAFGRELGVEIHTSLDAVPGPFDVVYSSHVLEHVSNPLATLRELAARVRPGGFLVAHTPNGSRARREVGFRGFHLHWGQVHPVLLSDRFVLATFPDRPVYLTSETNPEHLRSWRRSECRIGGLGDLDGEELFLAVRCDAS